MAADGLVPREPAHHVRIDEREGVYEALAWDRDRLGCARQVAAKVDPARGEQARAEREPLPGVVVPGGDHHRDAEVGKARQDVVEQPDRLGRRDRAIVDVAGHDDDVGPLLARQGDQLVEDPRLVLEQGFLVQRAAEVPVGRMEESQAHEREGTPGDGHGPTAGGSCPPDASKVRSGSGGGGGEASCLVEARGAARAGRRPSSDDADTLSR